MIANMKSDLPSLTSIKGKEFHFVFFGIVELESRSDAWI